MILLPIPTGRLILLFSLSLVFFVAALIMPFFIYVGIGLDVFLLLFALADIFFAPSPSDIEVEPGHLPPFSIGRSNEISFRMHNTGNKAFRMHMKIDVPAFIEDATDHGLLKIKPGQELKKTISFIPSRRGKYTVPFLYTRYYTFFRLFTIHSKKKIDLDFEVFPDIVEINQYLKMARRNRLDNLGIHKNRFAGMGTELEYLREYQKDDDSRRIDWKASTRLNKPVTKVFQMETSNYITFVLDCGRLMTAEQNGLSTLDYAINSLLMLSHIAHKMGDKINIIAFSDRILGEFTTTKTKDTLRRISSFVTRLQPDFIESNYKMAFEYLERKIKRRQLVIFFTDLIDDINYDVFKGYLSLLNRRHRTLFILLRDNLLHENAEMFPETSEQLYVSAAAREMYLRRQHAISKFKKQGISVIDIAPQQLTPVLVNKFMEIKSRNKL